MFLIISLLTIECRGEMLDQCDGDLMNANHAHKAYVEHYTNPEDKSKKQSKTVSDVSVQPENCLMLHVGDQPLQFAHPVNVRDTIQINVNAPRI